MQLTSERLNFKIALRGNRRSVENEQTLGYNLSWASKRSVEAWNMSCVVSLTQDTLPVFT